MRNDCLLHAFNYAVRYPFFVNQEQAVRLIQRYLKKGLDYAADMKTLKGVSARALKDVCVVDGRSWSLKLVQEPPTKGTDKMQSITDVEMYIKESMLDNNRYEQLILVGLGKGNCYTYVHAATFLRSKASTKKKAEFIYYMDNLHTNYFAYPTVPRSLENIKQFKFAEHLTNYQRVQLYCLNKRLVDERYAAKVHREMEYVMTGVKREDDYVHEARSEAFKKIN